MSFSEKDQDIWKNYQDYPDEYGITTEKEKNEEMVKIIVGLSVAVLFIPAGIIVFRKRVAIKIAFANWIQRTRRFFQSIIDRIRNFRNAPPTVELSIIHPTAIEFPESVVTVPTPPPPRYLSTRPIHICDQDASERRLREVSAVLNQFLQEPLPQFHFDSTSMNSESLSNVSTADSIQNRVSTPMDRTRVILQSMESLDPSGMLTPPPVVPNNTLDDNPLQVGLVSDESEGSVMQIADFPPIRQQPVRSTRNKVPIYKDQSDNETE